MKSQKNTPIGTVIASIARVSTTPDGGLKVLIDIPSDEMKQDGLAAKLLELAMNPQTIFISFIEN